jgi:hypothetical protein
MYTYNFKTRSYQTVFDHVEWFVFFSNLVKLDYPIDSFEIIPYKSTIAIGLKADVVEDFHILKLYDAYSGRCEIQGKRYSFSVQENGRTIFLSNGIP